MTIPYKALVPHILSSDTSFHQYRQGLPDKVTCDSPAPEVMTDLTRVKAVTITSGVPIDAALQKMIHAEVRLLLVVDARNTLLGLITARDIMGEKPVSLIAKTRMAREEILVEHIMTPKEKIQVLPLEDVAKARVGDLILTLKEAGSQHTLVVEKHGPGKDEFVRGIFSTTQIGKQLGVDIQPTGKVQSFAELEAVLLGSPH